jgi:hypothetical protein
MDGKLRPASGIASQTDALAKLEVEACPFFGPVVWGGTFWVLFLAVEKKCLARGCDYPPTNITNYYEDSVITQNPKQAKLPHNDHPNPNNTPKHHPTTNLHLLANSYHRHPG